MKKQPLRKYSRVMYKTRTGIIVGQWGSVKGCRSCGRLLEDSFDRSPCCDSKIEFADCSNVYDVQFGKDRVDAINRCWLVPV